jgi:hypothetical protein
MPLTSYHAHVCNNIACQMYDKIVHIETEDDECIYDIECAECQEVLEYLWSHGVGVDSM